MAYISKNKEIGIVIEKISKAKSEKDFDEIFMLLEDIYTIEGKTNSNFRHEYSFISGKINELSQQEECDLNQLISNMDFLYSRCLENGKEYINNLFKLKDHLNLEVFRMQYADKKDLGNVDVIYQAFTDRWWPKVKNREDWAGKGDGYPIRYLAICVSKGSIKGRVYTEKNGWLPYLTFKDKYDINDLENGVLGDGSPIQAIELYYNTPEGYEYKKVAYCVSGINRETFYPVQHDNETGKGYDGYAGVKGVAVDKFQAWIE